MSVIPVKSVIMYVSKDLSLEEFEQVMKEIMHERKEAERNKEAAFEAGVSFTVGSTNLCNSCSMTPLHLSPENSSVNFSANSGSTDVASLDSTDEDSKHWKDDDLDEMDESDNMDYSGVFDEGSYSQADVPIMTECNLEQVNIFVDLAEVMCRFPDLYSIPLIDSVDEVENNCQINVEKLVDQILNDKRNQKMVCPGSWFAERADSYEFRIRRRGERYPVSMLITSPELVPDELAGHIPTLEEFLARRFVPWKCAKSLLSDEKSNNINSFRKYTSERVKGRCIVSKVKPPSHPHGHVSGDGDQNHDHDHSNNNNGNQGDRHNGDARNTSSGSGNASSRSNKRSSHNGNASNKKQRQHALGVQGMKTEDELDEADDSEDDSDDDSDDGSDVDSEDNNDAEQVAKELTKTASGSVEPDMAPAQARTAVAADSSVAEDASHVEDATPPLKVDRHLFPASPLSDHRGPLRKEELKRKATVATDADETCTVAMTEPLVYKVGKEYDHDMEEDSVLTEPSVDDEISVLTEPSVDDEISVLTEPSVDDEISVLTEPLVYNATKGHILDMDGHSVLTEPLDHDKDPDGDNNDDDDDDDDDRAISGSKISAPILVRDNKRQFSMRSEEERASLQKQGVMLSLGQSASLLFAMLDQQRRPVQLDRQYILLRDFVSMMSGPSRSILVEKGATLIAQLRELLLGDAKLMAQATSFDSKERDALSERFSVALDFLRDVEAVTGQDLAQFPLDESVASSVQTDEVYIPRGRNPLCVLLLDGNYVDMKPTSKSEPVALLASRISSATKGKSVKTATIFRRLTPFAGTATSSNFSPSISYSSVRARSAWDTFRTSYAGKGWTRQQMSDNYHASKKL